jgi:NADH-quinone oxidoreductase subunit A
MNEASQLTEFGKIFIYIIMGIFFVLFTFFLGWLVAPKKPNPEKLSSYECGEEPRGNSWIQFNSRFYVIALIFLLFDVEMVFIFPWATVFGQEGLIAADPRWGWLSLAEMFIFIGILLIGLVYVWKKGDLNWIKPEPYVPISPAKIPYSFYQQLNDKTYQIKEFSLHTEPLEIEKIKGTSSPTPYKTPFIPKFKRSSE